MQKESRKIDAVWEHVPEPDSGQLFRQAIELILRDAGRQLQGPDFDKQPPSRHAGKRSRREPQANQTFKNMTHSPQFLRVALYARVSSEEQKQGHNIDSQIAELEDFAAHHQWPVIDIYREEAATPVETAILHVGTGTGGPTITGFLPSMLNGIDGNQAVQIIGSGFLEGAKVYWKSAGGEKQGPDMPDSFSTATITISNNFGDQTASWQVQVVNPNGTVSNWFPFQVTASTGAKPDLIPQQVTPNTFSVVAGGTVTVTFTVLNQGTGAAAASTTGFRLGTSSSNVPDSSNDIPN